jgi:hypothetical protein
LTDVVPSKPQTEGKTAHGQEEEQSNASATPCARKGTRSTQAEEKHPQEGWQESCRDT